MQVLRNQNFVCASQRLIKSNTNGNIHTHQVYFTIYQRWQMKKQSGKFNPLPFKYTTDKSFSIIKLMTYVNELHSEFKVI